jgi:hypothetical protein
VAVYWAVRRGVAQGREWEGLLKKIDKGHRLELPIERRTAGGTLLKNDTQLSFHVVRVRDDPPHPHR